MLKFIQNNREITALLAVVLLFALPGFLDRQYLSVQTLTMVYSSAQILILLAMGATLVMLTRNIDVSVGSITGMCAVLLGMLLNAGYSLPVACVATLLLGLLAYSAAIFLIPICISFDTAEKRRYATYLILNRRFSFEF